MSRSGADGSTGQAAMDFCWSPYLRRGAMKHALFDFEDGRVRGIEEIDEGTLH